MKHAIRNLRYVGLFCVMLLATVGTAQDRVLTGKILDPDGLGIPGATVLIKGTTRGTTTDANGTYKLSVGGGATLRITSVGFQAKEVAIGNETALSTTLAADQLNLDEVVVVGSTVATSRRTLGNAITVIKASQLQQTGTENLIGALQGKVAGAQVTQNSGDPSGGISVRLRGVKSVQGSSDPLYIIDGVVVSNASDNVSQLAPSVGQANPAQNRLADINPADIESINVINGAAAAAQYGSRASNGVIIINTKRGKTGAPQFTFTTSVNVSELRKAPFISTFGKQYGFADFRLHSIGVPTAAQIAANPSMTLTPITRDGVTSNIANNLVDVTRYNYFDQIFQTGYGTDNALSMSGGNDKTQYFASVSYMKNQGIIKGTDFQRYGLRLRVDQRLADWAKLSAGVTYSNSFSNEKPNGNVFYSPINSVTITNNIWDISKRDAAGQIIPIEPTRVNPISVIEEMSFTQRVNRTINDLQLNLTPFKGFRIDGIVGLDTYTQVGQNTILRYPYAAASSLGAAVYNTGFAGSASNTVTLFNADLNVTYETKFGENIGLTAIAGLNHQYSRKDFMSTTGEGLAPFVSTIGGASTNIAGAYGLDRFAVSGQFVQATLALRDKFYLTAAIRRDGSTIFSADEVNQLYPKISASYVLSDAAFWKNSGIASTINSVKLRTSFGDAGGVTALGTYDRFWQFSPIPYLGITTIQPSTRLANERVRPERMRELEGGIDIGLLNDKVTLGITAYKQDISDLVVSQALNPSSGGLSKIDNVGQMENKGIEVSLGITPIKNKDFDWNVNFIYSANRNKITKLPGGSIFIGNNFTTTDGVAFVEGQPASLFIGRTFARNPDGSLLLTSQGLPQSERGTQTSITNFKINERVNGQPAGAFLRTIVGNPNPDYTASVMSSLRYKNLNFRVLFDAVQGVDVFNADKRTRNNVGIGDLVEKEMKGELPRGWVYSLVPIEEFRVDDGSFVKLREISLSYGIPSPFKGLNNLNLSVTGRNLISWDNYNGFDPETNAGGNSSRLRGTDFGNVPIPKSYQVSLSAKF